MTAVLPDLRPSALDSAAADEVLAPRRFYGLDRAVVRAFLDFAVEADALPVPKWGPIGEEVYVRTYSRDIKDAGRREVWAETVRRVVLGNLALAPASSARADEDIDMFIYMYVFGVLPAGRHISATGTSMSNTRNCFAAGWEARTSTHTAWMARILFLGGGVGANYSETEIAVTRPIRSRIDVRIVCSTEHPDYAEIAATAGESLIEKPAAGTVTVVVPDTREGWTETWGMAIDWATEAEDATLVVDVSGIRRKGAPLKTMGGTASGPEPFVRALLGITEVLQGAVGRRLRGMEFMSMNHHVAAAVVAGGTRRSARMALMNWRDREIFDFIVAKSAGGGHWTANLSIETDAEFAAALDDGSHPLHDHAEAVLQAVSIGMALNGEPGFVNTEAHSVGERTRIHNVNPCAEVSLEPFESCNIGSINLDAFGSDFESVLHATELLARFLYRATLKAYPDDRAAAIEAINRRLGLGVLGLQGWALAHGVRLSELPGNANLRAKLTEMRLATRRSANEIADHLGLPRPIKVTAVAPTGTISSLPGATPGVSPVIYKRFVRRMRITSGSEQIETLRLQGFPIEPDAQAANTEVVSMPVRDAILDRFPADMVEDSTEIDFDQFMSIVQCVQDTLLGGTDGNAVSATAQIPANSDPVELADAMRPYLRGNLKGITVFPELAMAQAPFSPLTQEGYDAFLAELDESAAFYAAVGDSNDGSNCATGACPVV